MEDVSFTEAAPLPASPIRRIFCPLSPSRLAKLRPSGSLPASAPERARPIKYRNWTSDQLQKAVSDIERGVGSLREATRAWNVPKSTLHDHFSQKHLAEDSRRYFSEAEERVLLNLLFVRRRSDIRERFNRLAFKVETGIYNSISSKQIICLANEIYKSKGAKFPVIGREWFEGFRSRHKEISLRKAETLTRARLACTDQAILDK